jgi:hypothetical protein
VTADPRPRLEDVDARVVVGHRDDLPDVEPDVLADLGQLVGEGDVDVTERVLGQLRHLGRLGVGEDDLARHERPVDLCGTQRALGREPADDAVVREDLDHDPPGQHPLGAVREVHVGDAALVGQLEVGAQVRDPRGDQLRRSRG